jgi:hypothetical protein
MKIDYVIRKNKNKDNGLPLIKLNSKFKFENLYECKLFSKIVNSSKINLISNFEFANIESISKIVESSKI